MYRRMSMRVADWFDDVTDAHHDRPAVLTSAVAGRRAGHDPDEAEKLAASLKAIADPARLRLMCLVAAHEDREACVCDLTDRSACRSRPCRTT